MSVWLAFYCSVGGNDAVLPPRADLDDADLIATPPLILFSGLLTLFMVVLMHACQVLKMIEHLSCNNATYGFSKCA